MKYLVCISKVPDTTAKINFTNNNTELDTSGVNFIVNLYDECNALVRAIELKEADGGTVTILNVGLTENDPIIRKALAIGADSAVRINLNPTDSFQVAREIAVFAKNEQFDILFFGKETIDYKGATVPALVAEMLELPFVSHANEIQMNGNTATLQREIIGGTETNVVDTPFVLSTTKEMAEQRIPNMRGLMQARTKPLTVVEPTSQATKTTIKHFEKPIEKSSCRFIDQNNVAELLNLLKNEAKVL